MAPPRIYTQSERLRALRLVEAHGGLVTRDALATIRGELKAPNLKVNTIKIWMRRERSRLLAKSDRPIDEQFEEVARRMLEVALDEEKISRMTPNQAMVSAGIAVDKMRLLRGLPTEIFSVLPEVMEVFGGAEAMMTAFRQLVERARQLRELGHGNQGGEVEDTRETREVMVPALALRGGEDLVVEGVVVDE